MPSSAKTSYLQLNSWSAGDKPKMADFNSDNQKVDSALQAHVQNTALHLQGNQSTWVAQPFVTGTYTGDDAASRTISLGFQPRALFIEAQDGRRDASRISGGLALPGAPMCRWSGSASSGPAVLQLTASGFQVSNDTSIYGHLNNNTMNYRYLAVK